MQRLQVDMNKVEVLEAPYRDFHEMPHAALYRRLFLTLRHQVRKYYFAHPPTWRVLLRSMSGQARMRPSFFSIGAPRSGTSALSSYILQHPHVVLPLAKEPMPTIKLRDTLAQFPTKRAERASLRKYGGAITGYCAPVIPYMPWIYMAKAVQPDAKIVLILRDPVERAFSHWRLDQLVLARAKDDPLWSQYPDFETIVELEIEACRRGGAGFQALYGSGSSYFHHSIYLPFIETLFKHFDRESILIVNASDFYRDPQYTALRIYEFLGIPRVEPVLLKEKNAGPKYVMSDATRSRLIDFFKPHNQALYSFIGQDFGWHN
jgi:hypothetical protein